MSFFNGFAKKIALALLLSLSLPSCLPYQAFLYMIPDEKDIHRFKHEEVQHATTCYAFKERTEKKPIYLLNWTHKVPLIKTRLETFLKAQKASHFLVIKNDTVVFDYTDPSIDTYEPYPTFSIAKSFVSAALGVAIKEGYISASTDLAKKYLPELNYHKNFDELTINHLLNQSSGLRSEIDGITNAYYGKIEKVLKALHFNYIPGEQLEYVNINTILVGIILERATGRKLHQYFSEKIWTKIGTCDSTVWAYDHKTEHTRSFCCFGGSPRDYAKFGQLYLNKGMWGTEQVMDSNWINRSTAVTNALGENVGYNNNWFIGDKQVGDYMAVGMFRQQIYINPKEKVVIVCLMKFNNKNLPLRWWQLLRQIADQV